jgi:D-glycero-alpha-D-manno-heptose-7-phosphate kinase
VAIVKAFVELLKLPLGEYNIAHLAYESNELIWTGRGANRDGTLPLLAALILWNFMNKNRVIVNPLRIKNWVINELEVSLILYYTGISRYSSQVIEMRIQNVQEKNKQAIAATHQLKKEAILFKEALLKSDFMGIAEILRTSWEAKKKLSKLISNPEIDRIYQVARETGPIPGKMSGASRRWFYYLYGQSYQENRSN